MAEETKQSLLNYALLALTLRSEGHFDVSLPLHGLFVLAGPPGTGKTTLARGLANQLATVLKGKLGTVRLVELNPHVLTSEMLGQSQRSVVKIFEEEVPSLVAAGPIVLLLDEVEALAASRSTTSLETNPVDVHRATNAVLSGLDRLAVDSPRLVTLATTNFSAGVDAAFLSRADLVIEVPLPDTTAIEKMLRDTLKSLGSRHLPLSELCERKEITQVARYLVGKDGRQVRKFVLDVLARDVEHALNPGLLTMDDLIAAAERLKPPARKAS